VRSSALPNTLKKCSARRAAPRPVFRHQAASGLDLQRINEYGGGAVVPKDTHDLTE
jgi:hypothetical protein